MRMPFLTGFALFGFLGSFVAVNADSNWRFLPDARMRSSDIQFETGSGAIAGMTGSEATYFRRTGGAQKPGIPGVLEQKIPVESWRGKRVRLTLHLRNTDAAPASVFAYIRKSNHTVINATPQPLARSALWQSRQFVLEVPDNATDLAVQLRLFGEGTLWVDRLTPEAVGTDIALTPSRRIEVGGPIPGDSGPIVPPWMGGSDYAAHATSWASPTHEAPH